jgi:cell division septum initiation protein DivIVA
MSALNPDLSSGDLAGSPEFVVAMRGYDRIQVDEYVARLGEWLAEAHGRAETAERTVAGQEGTIADLRDRLREATYATAPSAAVEAATARAAEALAVALGEADAIRNKASEDAQAITEMARQQAVDTVRSAQLAVAGLADTAQDDRKAAAQALESARQEAERKGRELIDEARAEAARVREEAGAAARQAAEQDAIRTELAEETLAKLSGQRSAVVEQLSQLRGAIEALVNPAVDESR